MDAAARPVVERVALKLSNADGAQIGMATLISPSIALTSAHLVDNHQSYLVEPAVALEPTTPVIEATVIARDSEFAVLELYVLIEIDLPSTLLATAEPGIADPWHCFYISAFREPVRLFGPVVGVERVNDQRFLKLFVTSSDNPPPPGSGGAPVTVFDQIVGVMAEAEGQEVYAIPLTEIMRSPQWKLVEKARQSPNAAATAPEPPLPQIRVTRDGGQLREGPRFTSRIVTGLPVNSVVERLEESADKRWLRVRTEQDGATIEGWVVANLLEPGGDPVTTAAGVSAAPFDRIAFVKRLTNSAASALAHATGMRVAQRHNKLHMEHLVAGLFQKEDGPARTEFRRVGIDQDQLAKVVKEVVGTALPGDYTPLLITDELSPLSEHVERALSAAAALADESGSKSIRSRDLLRGAFSVADCTLIQALIDRGVDPEKFRLEPDPDQKPDQQLAPRRPTQAGIKSDDPDGQDLLDIKNEVEALCTVLASKEVKPPISLGLFGDWGSGKSFFMKKMEARFNKLQEIARQEDSAYCANIVQLWFNAWHYMDTNLWASLATEIFDELAQELARQDAIAAGRDPDYERAQLVAQKASANEEVAKADQEKREADAKVRASQQQLASVRSGETEVAMDPQAVLRAGYRFAVQQPEVRQTIEAAEDKLNAQVAEAARTLNLKPADSAKAQLLELQGLWGYLRAIVLAVRNTNKTRLILMLIAFAVTTAAVLWLLPYVVAQNWIQPTWARISSAALVLLATISPFLPAARRAIQIVAGAIKANQEAIEKARLETEKNLQSRHQQLQQDADEAQRKLEAATANAKQLAEQLDNLRSDRKMSNFIRQRQQSSDYTKYLGVIARARNDFEQLSTLLAKEQERSAAMRKRRREQSAAANVGQQKDTEETEDIGGLLPPIDRIILYIDDLDRCPEDKVVDVLQAVHLLLAFPLFVVVVGVDPRWLLHSLRQHSKAFREQMENDASSEEERTHWRSTPLNYLEKIFQIPFTLRPMGESGFGKMIETLTRPPEEQQANEETRQSEKKAPETIQRAAETGVAETPPAETAAQPPATTAVAEGAPAIAADDARESWTTKLRGLLRRAFGNPSREAVKTAADSRAEQQVSAGPVATGTSARVTPEPSPQEVSTAASQTAQTQTAANQDDDAGQAGAETIDPRPDHLLINQWEQEFMKQLHELIPSPRATKRFINIYRLIRASVDLDDKLRLEDFNGKDGPGKYRPVLLLLAILTGYPDQATEILRELLERAHPETWWEFVDSFNSRAEKTLAAGNEGEPPVGQLKTAARKDAVSSKAAAASTTNPKPHRPEDNATLNDKVANLLSDAEAESWKQLLEKLRSLRHLFKPSQSCADFVEWAPKVARYSFQSGRVLLTRGVRDAEQKTGAE